MVASAIAAERLTLLVLRLLEGYWTRPRWLRRRLVDYRRWRRGRWQERVDRLSLRQRIGALPVEKLHDLAALEATPDPGAEQLDELRRLRALREEGLDARMTSELGRGRRYLRESPTADAMGMPTRLGDILRAAEQRPLDKYGLNAVVCWYPLWLLLPGGDQDGGRPGPNGARQGHARMAVGHPVPGMDAVDVVGLPIGIVVPALIYQIGILGAARLFGELIGSAFDLYRFRLYDELHLPRPASPVQERRRAGKRVNGDRMLDRLRRRDRHFHRQVLAEVPTRFACCTARSLTASGGTGQGRQ